MNESATIEWPEVQRLFDLCRDRPRDEWHAIIRAECRGRDAVAFEALTLLVAAEGLPPLDGAP
ncbi:MAG: hypothetical protein ACKO0W_05885 [Planctomycetota bacterium]